MATGVNASTTRETVVNVYVICVPFDPQERTD